MSYVFHPKYKGPFGDAILFTVHRMLGHLVTQDCFSKEEQGKLSKILDEIGNMANERCKEVAKEYVEEDAKLRKRLK